MLSNSQEKLIRALHTKKGRREHDKLLVEGHKNIREAGDLVEFTFTPDDTRHFKKLVSTQAPQPIAAVVRRPTWTDEDIESRDTVVVLDGIQDPGNVGSILRLGLGFDAAVILVESADITSPKVVRSSAGGVFKCPWLQLSRRSAENYVAASPRTVLRLEVTACSTSEMVLTNTDKAILIAGSEGNGILMETPGLSVAVRHNCSLESLNVGHAIAIALHERYAHS